MKSALPPLAALRAFAVAGRRGSFREAAAELGVTPSAVSHQVKTLEDWLEAPLFERAVRHVLLTPAGEALSDALNAAFTDIETALARIRSETAPTHLRISALPLFTNSWLVPRLARFEARRPGLSIAIETSNRIVDLAREDIDVAIRSARAASPGLTARKLLDLRATPLCAPSLARAIKTPEDLAGATLIDISARPSGWAEWFAGIGAPNVRPKRTLAFDTVPSAIEAAAQGRGVLLGLLPLIWDAPNADGLVAPLDCPPVSAGAYFTLCRKGDATRPHVRAFIDWLSAEMRADLTRLKRIERERLRPPSD